jgi:DNA-binding transcriptional LysR family regulator
VGSASRSMGISPSAISHSIASLETELGHQLFMRERKRIYLTTHGRILMNRAAQILKDLGQLKEDLSSPDVPFEGHYKIAATRSLAAYSVANVWARYQADHPKLSVEICTLRSIEIMAKAASNDVDLGICFDPIANPTLSSKEIGTDEYRIALRKKHPIASLSSREVLREIQNYSACMHKSLNGLEGYELHPIFDRLKIRPRVDFIYDSYEVVLPRIIYSDSWALLPARLLRTAAKDVLFLEIKNWNAPVSIAAVWPRYKHLSPALTQFLVELEKRFRADA